MKKITQVIDAANKTLPQQGMGGKQVLPAVAAQQRPAAVARGKARQVRKPKGC
jgi:hypothetical protein